MCIRDRIVLCDPHRAIVVGASKLHGTYMDTPDIRAGLGMVAASVCWKPLDAELSSRVDAWGSVVLHG